MEIISSGWTVNPLDQRDYRMPQYLIERHIPGIEQMLGGDEEDRRYLVFLEQRQDVRHVVGIAVIESQENAAPVAAEEGFGGQVMKASRQPREQGAEVLALDGPRPPPVRT